MKHQVAILVAFLCAMCVAQKDVSATSYQAAVTALIDAGTCADLESNSNCGDDASSFYETFEYNSTHRVIIVSGAPDHSAETDLYDPTGAFNPNIRCERWQYSIIPLNPTWAQKNWTYYTAYPFYPDYDNMDQIGHATSGGVFFDTRATTTALTAFYMELDTLDTCMGHSNPDLQYHYHGCPYLMPHENGVDTGKAANSSICQFVGYMFDGFPVYGLCQDYDTGTDLQSCWTNNTATPEYVYDYDFGSTASGDTCYLDEANGYWFTNADHTSDGYTGYGYVTTAQFSAVPIGLNGDEFGTYCGFTP